MLLVEEEIDAYISQEKAKNRPNLNSAIDILGRQSIMCRVPSGHESSYLSTICSFFLYKR